MWTVAAEPAAQPVLGAKIRNFSAQYWPCRRLWTNPATRWVLSCCSTTTFCCCCNYQNFASKFAKFDRIFFRFCKILKILQIFIDCLWFLAIPTKFRKNLDEKSPIWDDFSNILQKSQKITEILQIFAKNLQILNLKRCKGMSIL